MNAAVDIVALRTAHGHAAFAVQHAKPQARIALVGVGTVGCAVLARLDALAAHADLALHSVSNSRHALHGAQTALSASTAQALLHTGTASDLQHVASALGSDAGTSRIVIDATASARVAAQHAAWLGAGIHVVTANKLGIGSDAIADHAIRTAAYRGRSEYGDAATVGAGLPLLRSIRALRAGGDRILGIAGVLSGSLGWLFSEYDGARPFSACLAEARDRGFTEPDPRADLSFADMRRKLVILARAAGHALEPSDVAVESLVPAELAARLAPPTPGDWTRFDAIWQQRLDTVRRDGRVLRPVARLDEHGARVGLEALAPDDPLAQARGCDNRVAIRSTRYDQRALLIEGPGAGADITAAALLDDVLSIAARHQRST